MATSQKKTQKVTKATKLSAKQQNASDDAMDRADNLVEIVSKMAHEGAQLSEEYATKLNGQLASFGEAYVKTMGTVAHSAVDFLTGLASIETASARKVVDLLPSETKKSE